MNWSRTHDYDRLVAYFRIMKSQAVSIRSRYLFSMTGNGLLNAQFLNCGIMESFELPNACIWAVGKTLESPSHPQTRAAEIRMFYRTTWINLPRGLETRLSYLKFELVPVRPPNFIVSTTAHYTNTDKHSFAFIPNHPPGLPSNKS